ncbi:MAG TPA: formate dehydrogenase accessory sulfurtransferase FdhD, partial [Anaerolineae bacterium]|nr:formate dehydrogenase accessory sulfurtransferase FdhD [Anaerolineae bacterium]
MKRYRQPYRPEESSLPGVMPWLIHRVTEDGRQLVEGGVVVEEPLEIRVNGHPVAVLMRTPGMEKELAAGFCLGEGIVADLGHVALVQHCGRALPGETAEGDALDESRNRVDVRLMPGVEPPPLPESVSLIRSGCGRTDAAEMAEGLVAVNGSLRIAAGVLVHLVGRMTLQQEAYRVAGGIHAAAVFDARGRTVVVCEDIGRHNAVDKAMGYCLLRGIPLHDKMVMSTGRA